MMSLARVKMARMESQREIRTSYVQGFGGVFRGISLSGSLHSFVRFD